VAAEPGSTYTVQPNDTLWQIASAAYPGTSGDVNRAMVAIYQANPGAFGGNINVLRAGSDLRMPSGGDVEAISASAAADEVARQYQAWRAGTAAPSAGEADGGRLRLVTPEQGSAAPSTATQAKPADAPAAELQTRVQQLEGELAEARRLLEVRNAELATLQGSAAAVVEPGAAAAEAPPAEGGEAVAPGTEAPVAVAEPEPVVPAVVEPEPKPESKPTAPAEESSPSLFDRLREYWWALLALLAAALGIAVLLRKRQSAGGAEADLEEALGRRTDDLRSRMASPPLPREPSIVVEERKPVEAALATAAPVAAVTRAPEPSRKPVAIDDTLSGEGPVSIEAGDPLAEADFHMAYGLYDQAADLVQVASKREPQRRDLKLKLLEIYFVWGNKDRFLEVAREMGASRREAQPGEWDKILIMGRQLAPEDPLFASAARSAPESLDMELSAADAPLDMELTATRVGTLPDVDLTATAPNVEGGEGGLDFILDEPVRGADEDAALAPTIETPRMRSGTSDEPTTEVPIEDLGLDVGDLEGLDDLGDLEQELTQKSRAVVEDTVERPGLAGSAADDDDLLSSTSIMGGDAIAQMIDEPEPGVIDLSDATGELPTLETHKLDATGLLPKPEFGLDAEAATMSEVGTKLDLARAYIDMGDPEGARSILDEVLKEGSPNQRREAERLLAGLP
jgi:pilus assembly protein FimV